VISFAGYEKTLDEVNKYGQDHVFAHWDELVDKEKKILMDDLSQIDFPELKRLFLNMKKTSSGSTNFGPPSYVSLPADEKGFKKRDEARIAGIEYIKKCKMAAMVVAGGQGTRLGFSGAKGIYPIGAISKKSFFQLYAEKLIKYNSKYGVRIPWLVMTSKANHADTVEYMSKNGFFGLNAEDVRIFPQDMIPSIDSDGRIMLESKCTVFKNPDGHGGCFQALNKSGALDEMKKRGIETISYFQVDNPVTKIIDPVFIGMHTAAGSDASCKCVKKKHPDERVGLFVGFGGRTGVVEYSDMPHDKLHVTDPGGRLLYNMGNLAIHLFNISFIEKILPMSGAMPYHHARKTAQIYINGKIIETECSKFEKFVFDALPLAEKNLLLEVVREEEFAPVKNLSGEDSVESSRKLMTALHVKWLRSRGIEVRDSVREIEISPLYAVEAEDIDKKMLLPEEERIYIEI
jgi:UDP-N-acetylglucosamine/UDP-N-acetylgalactosamine diphosphorylase